MPYITIVAITFHILSAIVWVGGMFFAYVVLRPSLGFLEPPERLVLWNKVFPRFFFWVWIAAIALPVSGYIQVFLGFGGFEAAGMGVRIMHAIGLLMIAIYAFLYFVTFAEFRSAVEAEDWPRAGGVLARIRRLVGINLILGLLTSIIGATGRFWT